MQAGQHFRGNATEKGQRTGRLAALELNPCPWDQTDVVIVAECVPDLSHKEFVDLLIDDKNLLIC